MGFNSAPMPRRMFAWQMVRRPARTTRGKRSRRAITRCWFSDEEAAWLEERVLVGLPSRHRTGVTVAYGELQEAVCMFVAEAMRWNAEVDMSTGRRPLGDYARARAGGGVGRPAAESARALHLLDEAGRLRSEVEAFKRSVLGALGA